MIFSLDGCPPKKEKEKASSLKYVLREDGKDAIESMIQKTIYPQ